MNARDAATIVQIAFPQIYLACHSRHQRKRSNATNLSQRDAAILAHLSPTCGIAPSALARHLGIARSTLSEALKHLVRLGYAKAIHDGDRKRLTSVVLTEAGVRAVSSSSVLESARLLQALKALSPGQLSTVTDGMTLLANACRSISAPSAE